MGRFADLAFLAGGGETGAWMRDQAALPFGPSGSWPSPLRAVVGMVLQSKQPMLVAWGPELHSFYNDAFIPAVGAKHPASLGQPYATIWAEVWDELRPLTEAVLRGEAQYFDDVPFALVGRAGREVSWFSFSYTPLRDEHGVPAGFLVIAVETTDKVLLERRQAFRLTLEDLLRNLAHPREIMAAAAELLGRHLGAGRCGYGEVDETGEFVVLERDWTDGVMPSAAGRHRVADFGAEFFAAYRAGQTIRIDDLHSDPRVVGTDVAAYSGLGGVRARLTVPLVKDGRFVASLYVHQAAPRRWTDEEAALVRDVAERTWAAVEQARAEAALRELNGTLERRVAERTAERDRLWRNSQDLLVVIDTTGVFLAVNPVVTAILGWAPEELVGRPLFEFIHPDDQAMTTGALAHATLDALPVVENRYRHKDGTYRWLSWVAAPEDGFIYATARHVTAEKEQAEALRQAEEALRQSQKMEAVGQLTGGLAHDFNNLLTGISGSLELLQTRLSQGRVNELDRYITAAEGAARRAASLTHRLLAFSRRQTLDPKPTNINRLVGDIEELIRRTVGPRIQVEVVGAAGLWTALVDPNQLENALLNLCINARDAMPDGGRLTIETANKWLDERAARERELSPGQYLSLCVTDTGTGMAPEVIRRAFDPFFTTKPLGQGTGLGLSMIYGFARQSGGQVRIYSEIGRGTTMCVYLPRHHGDASDANHPRKCTRRRRQAAVRRCFSSMTNRPCACWSARCCRNSATPPSRSPTAPRGCTCCARISASTC